MITVNMHEAKTRLSELVREEVAEIRRRAKRRRPVRDLTPDPRLRVEFAPGYDPTEPLSEKEWPASLR